MNTTLERWFLAVTILAGLLTTSFPIAAKDDRPEVRMQAAHQNQLADRNEAAIKAGARFASADQPAGASNGSGMIMMISVADSSVRVLKTLPSADPHKVSRPTVLAGAPWELWCRLFPKWRGCLA